jgi:predicted nucleotidyltransferase
MDKRYDLDGVKQAAVEYAKVLQTNMNVSEMYLFGSYVKGTNHKDSDIDIAVVSDDFVDDCMDDGVRLMKLSVKIDPKIEPHPFLPRDFNNDNLIANEVIKTGIRII